MVSIVPGLFQFSSPGTTGPRDHGAFKVSRSCPVWSRDLPGTSRDKITFFFVHLCIKSFQCRKKIDTLPFHKFFLLFDFTCIPCIPKDWWFNQNKSKPGKSIIKEKYQYLHQDLLNIKRCVCFLEKYLKNLRKGDHRKLEK